jgi:hypothetical protein
MLAILGGLGNVERRAGFCAAPAPPKAGATTWAARRPTFTEAQKTEARRRRAEDATLAELARSYHVGKSTISRLVV